MAIIKEFMVNENLALMAYRDQRYGRFCFMNWKWITEQNINICDEYNVKTQSVHFSPRTLSGGNQQRIVVVREFDVINSGTSQLRTRCWRNEVSSESVNTRTRPRHRYIACFE